jgi:hypothetical protein
VAAVTPARVKDTWGSWRDRPRAANTGTEEKRKQGERWAALNEYIRRHGGAVTSVPSNKTLRIEIARSLSAKLTDELTALGYAVMPRGSTTRITGGDTVSARAERLFGVKPPSAFTECDVLEIRLDGR